MIEVLPRDLGLAESPSDARALLERLKIHRLATPIPFEEEGPVNCFVLENGPELGGVSLFDSGVRTREGTAALLAGLEALGLSRGDVTRVIVSHGHLDHFGNAALFAEAGAEIHAHPADWNKVHPDRAWLEVREARWRGLFARLGLTPEELESLERYHLILERMSKPPARDRMRPLSDGARFTFAACEGEIVHVPGHTPGICVLLFRDGGLLLSADHLLEHTSPNPVMEPGRDGPEDKPRALVDYLASVRRVRELDVEWVGPGHGPLFGDHRGLIDRLLGFYDRRQARLLGAVAAQPGTTTAELGRSVFARAWDRATFLVASEVIGNLEVLEARGELVRTSDASGVDRWYAPGES